MKQKRPRNGIKTIIFTVRLDTDLHAWIKDSGVNASEIINEHLRVLKESWYKNQLYLYENIPPYDEPYNEKDPLPF